ncbi:hypothetical protein F511_30181 [Dorcoceras hygrometricum]|uniref:Dystroglycan-like n=1 Tax=Dorcoceras hygrometricum TaxID=472368 RepID=A0A2Z7CGV1_9LAMI|nr:hypothetical protein F511_30181 [Dorcoceras hygrometricum]
MASSLISNTNQVHFSSVVAMDNAGMVAMFEALVASGLNGFLGCMSDIFETALVEFYQNDSVRDGRVISTVQGKSVQISEEVFARIFQLPVEGLTDMNEVPKDLVFDARTEFSFTGEKLTNFCKKRELKIDFRLLSDILAKSVILKAGSFDAVTHERFLMMTAINGGVKINWGRLLFNIFTDMVMPGSRQARGYAVKICILLKNVRNLDLGDSKEFPPLKILTARTVGRYISINKKISVEDVEDVGDVSRVKKTPVKRAVSKKRPATTVAELVVRKKRKLKGKAAPSNKNLELVSVAQEVVPLQVIKPITAAPPKTKRKAPKRKLIFPAGSADEIVEEETCLEKQREEPTADVVVNEPVVVTFVEKEKETSGDDLDSIIQQILEDTAQFEVDRMIDVENDPDEERRTDDEFITLEEILSTIPAGCSLPSTTGEVTKIQLAKSIQFRVVDEGDWYKASLPKISSAEKGKAPLHEKDPIKGNLTKEFLWEKTCFSKIFEGKSRDRGAVIARSNINTKSSCWIRTIVRVNDSWVIEPCADYWKPLPRQVVCYEVLPQLSYVYTLPTVSEFFKLLKKRWADVCLESTEFFVSGTLLPVGSLNFCRALTVFEPAQGFGFRRPTITSWGWSQLCTTFVRYSLFGGLKTVDISNFISVLIPDRPVLRDVNILDTVVQSAPVFLLTGTSTQEDPIVQMDIDQHPDSPPTSADSSLHFNANDIPTEEESANYQLILPYAATPTTTDNAASFAQLGASIDQDRAYRVLLNSIRQEIHDQKTLLSLDFLTSQKRISTQVAAMATCLTDVQKDVQDTKDNFFHHLLDFRAQAQGNYNNLTTQFGELVDYINRGGNDKKGEESSSRQPQPPPDDQNRPSGGSACRGSGSGGSSRRGSSKR